MVFEKYKHHGNEVWVRSGLKGLHRKYCLCFECTKLKIGARDNCRIAKQVYDLCVREKLVLPVFECPEFEKS